MNREIEFRVWLKDRKMMFEVLELDFEHKYIEYKEYEDEEIGYDDKYAGFDEIELMQYTGLKDRNGVKIFEGDIVKDDKERIFVIEYEFGGFNVVPIDYYNDELFSWNSLGDIQTASWLNESTEIIGNIYENKELLEDE